MQTYSFKQAFLFIFALFGLVAFLFLSGNVFAQNTCAEGTMCGTCPESIRGNDRAKKFYQQYHNMVYGKYPPCDGEMQEQNPPATSPLRESAVPATPLPLEPAESPIPLPQEEDIRTIITPTSAASRIVVTPTNRPSKTGNFNRTLPPTKQ